MANGQTSFGGGFGQNRFVMAPIVEGQPVGTIPGEEAPRLGESVLSRVRPPEKPPVPSEFEELENMDPRQVADQAKRVFNEVVFSIQQQVELQRKGAPINLKPFLDVMLPQATKFAKVWGDALERAGLSRLIADQRLAQLESRIPQIPLSSVKTKPGENVDFFRGEQRVGGIANPPLPTVVPQGGILAEARTGRVLTRGRPTPRKADTQVVAARDEDGNLVNVLVSKVTGKVINEFGRGPDVRFEPQTVPGVGRQELADLDEAEIGTRNAIRGSFDLANAVRKAGPAALGAPGVLSGLAQGFVSQMIGFAQLAGVNIGIFESGAKADTAGTKAESIFAEIDKAGTLNAEIRSAIVNLAFAAAAASGQTGRGVSDRDYERFVRELGAGASKPEVFASVLTKFAQRLNSNFATRFKVKMRRVPGGGKDPAPDLFKEIFGASGANAAPGGGTAGAGAQRAAGLAEGTIATNPNTGESLVVRGGKWVSR